MGSVAVRCILLGYALALTFESIGFEVEPRLNGWCSSEWPKPKYQISPHALLYVQKYPYVIRILLSSNFDFDAIGPIQITSQHFGSPEEGLVSCDLPAFDRRDI